MIDGGGLRIHLPFSHIYITMFNSTKLGGRVLISYVYFVSHILNKTLLYYLYILGIKEFLSWYELFYVKFYYMCIRMMLMHFFYIREI